MPVLQLSIGQLEEKVKKELIQGLTDKAAQTTGIPKESFIVMIQEQPLENVGVGGHTLKEIMSQRESS